MSIKAQKKLRKMLSYLCVFFALTKCAYLLFTAYPIPVFRHVFYPFDPPLEIIGRIDLSRQYSRARRANHPFHMNTKCEIHRRPIEFQATTRIFLTSTFYHVSRGDKGSLSLFPRTGCSCLRNSQSRKINGHRYLSRTCRIRRNGKKQVVVVVRGNDGGAAAWGEGCGFRRRRLGRSGKRWGKDTEIQGIFLIVFSFRTHSFLLLLTHGQTRLYLVKISLEFLCYISTKRFSIRLKIL